MARPALSALGALNVVEALATPHGIDRYLELVHPMLTIRDLRGEIVEVRHQTADTVTLTLRPNRRWRGHQAGQFVQIGLEIDGVRRTRCYSPANAANIRDGRIELTVKAHPDGLVSQYLVRNARPGMVVHLAQAAGEFRLPAARPDKVLLIAGGSGITPVMSMLRTLVAEGHRGEIAFLYYANSEADVPYLDELREIAAENDNVTLVLGYTLEDTGDVTGFFGREHVEAAAPWYREAETFLCGPPALMKSVRSFFLRKKLDDRLHFEDFAPAPAALPSGEVTGAVTFANSNLAVSNEGKSLLETAEAAGLNPDYGCRMGICFTCTSKKTSGTTTNLLTGETNSDPDIEIQLCVTAACGDVELAL